MHLGSRRQKKIWDRMSTSLNDRVERVWSAIVSRGDAIYIVLADIADGIMKVFVSLYKMITEWHMARGILSLCVSRYACTQSDRGYRKNLACDINLARLH